MKMKLKKVIGVLGYCVIVLSIGFLSSFAFAQEKSVELTTKIAKIPAARIIDWNGQTPTVNGLDGWQEQALSVNDKVCCPSGQAEAAFVLVALNRSADNLVKLSTGSCLTIEEDEGSSADEVSCDGAEALFDIGLLEEGSSFTVETPEATVGVSGTTFNVIVDTVANSTEIEVLEVYSGSTLTADDKNPDVDLGDSDTAPQPEYTLGSNQDLTIIQGAANIGPDFLEGNRGRHLGQMKQMMGAIATKSKAQKREFQEDEDKDEDYYPKYPQYPQYPH